MEYEKKFNLKEKSHGELSVTIKQADVEQGYKDLLNKYSKELQIPGFRKGHVPVSVLETKYGDAIKGDLAGDLVEDALKEIFDTLDEYERPLPYSYPVMDEKPILKPDADFSFTVHYDVFPKIDVKMPEKFKIDLPEVSVTDADIQKELEKMQERNALVTDCKADEPAKKEHIATIDYCELDESGNLVENSERKDFVFTIGSGENFYKIDDDILGMKKGESKEITKTYPEDEANKDLAGKTKKIKVTITALKYKDLPKIDDDLAQDVNEKYKTLEDLKADIRNNLQNGIDNQLKKIKERRITKLLTTENSVEVPESMLQAELESRWRMMAHQFRSTPEQMEKVISSMGQSKSSYFENWKEDAEGLLKGRILIETLLKQHNFEVKDEDIEAEYTKLAKTAGMGIDEIKKYYDAPNQKEYLIDEIKEDKLFNGIYEKCDFTKGKKMSVEEFFNAKEE